MQWVRRYLVKAASLLLKRVAAAQQGRATKFSAIWQCGFTERVPSPRPTVGTPES